MSEFLKLAYELIAKIIYNISEWVMNFIKGFVKVFITGWAEYKLIIESYFPGLNAVGKVLSVILIVILILIPVAIIVLIVRGIILNAKLRADGDDNVVLYREISRLNKQVLQLMDEKNAIMKLKMGPGAQQAMTQYAGVSALDGNGEGAALGKDALVDAASTVAEAQAIAKQKAEQELQNTVQRFPKLSLVDEKYRNYVEPEYNTAIRLDEFAEGYRRYAGSILHLYYTPEIIRRFIAGMAASHILILEGISGTGKTSLPYSFSRYIGNPATIVSVQPSYRDRSELIGYFNEFSKKFNETEFLRALYEAGYRQEPTLIVLDEMNLARIEYYFAEMLSVLEMPNPDEWIVDLVPTEWPGDPERMHGGKIKVSTHTWFVGTANSDDSTFTITDKVYDRAMPIELNQRADKFECEPEPQCIIPTEYLQELFARAKEEHPISDDTLDKMVKMDNYLQTRFKLAFGNRIMKQMNDFIPVYVSCGGTELGGLDYILARKVLKKFESMNVSFVRDEIKNLIVYMDKVFGEGTMPDCIEYLNRIQNMY